MCSFKIICVTSRKLCDEPLERRVKSLLDCGIDRVILREKDLPLNEYIKLAETVLEHNNCSEKISLHCYPQSCEILKHPFLHVSIPVLLQNKELSKCVSLLGVSVHSAEEALTAQALGADYITAGHIFATDCKRGVPPRGLEFLTSVINNVEIPVYAIGGIDKTNIGLVKESGAKGACIMSGLMTCDDVFSTLRAML